MLRPSQKHSGYVTALVHRLSGLALALFLPLHFLVLGLALEGAATLDSALAWSDSMAVKVAEWGLIILFAAHLGAGLRLLAIELLPWRGHRRKWIGWTAAACALVGGVFAVSVLS